MQLELHTRRTAEGIEVMCCDIWLPCLAFANRCPNCGTEYNWAGEPLFFQPAIVSIGKLTRSPKL